MDDEIEIGDDVCLSAQFLIDTGQQAGEEGHWHGTVTHFNEEIPYLAEINLGQGITRRVNVANLIKTKHRGADSSKSRPGFMKTFKGL